MAEKEKKNIRKTIKLIDSNLYATKGKSRHQKKNKKKMKKKHSAREKIGIAKVFRSSRKKTAESRAKGMWYTICSTTGTGHRVLYMQLPIHLLSH